MSDLTKDDRTQELALKEEETVVGQQQPESTEETRQKALSLKMEAALLFRDQRYQEVALKGTRVVPQISGLDAC